MFFCANCKENNITLLLVSAGFLGASILSIVPAAMVNCAECTFPIPEEMSLGILYAGANIAAVGFTFLGQYLLTLESFEAGAPFFPYGVWCMISMIVGIPFVLVYRGEYLRSQHDRTRSSANPDGTLDTGYGYD